MTTLWIYDLQNTLSLTAFLKSCKLKAGAFFLVAIHLMLGLLLFLLSFPAWTAKETSGFWIKSSLNSTLKLKRLNWGYHSLVTSWEAKTHLIMLEKARDQEKKNYSDFLQALIGGWFVDVLRTVIAKMVPMGFMATGNLWCPLPFSSVERTISAVLYLSGTESTLGGSRRYHLCFCTGYLFRNSCLHQRKILSLDNIPIFFFLISGPMAAVLWLFPFPWGGHFVVLPT